MPIDLLKRRRGSLSMEAVMLLPVALVMILLSRFVLEAMMNRQEVAVLVRGATATAAAADSPLPLYCDFDRAPFAQPGSVTQSPTTECARRGAEQGLRSEPRFWEALRQGASPWSRILRDVDQTGAVMDMTGTGSATMAFTRPEFLRIQSPGASHSSYVAPTEVLWSHLEDSLRASYDPVFWQALREQGTWRLFPEVFPARDG